MTDAEQARLQRITALYGRYINGVGFTCGDMISIAPEMAWPAAWRETPGAALPFESYVGVGIFFKALIQHLGSIEGVSLPLSLINPRHALTVMQALSG